MARRRSDIPQGRAITPDVLYWAPDAPNFLDRREMQQPQVTSTVLPYEQARRKAQEASAKREADARRRSGGASLIDFGSLETAHAFEERQYGVGDYFDARPQKQRRYLWDEDYDEARDSKPVSSSRSDVGAYTYEHSSRQVGIHRGARGAASSARTSSRREEETPRYRSAGYREEEAPRYRSINSREEETSRYRSSGSRSAHNVGYRGQADVSLGRATSLPSWMEDDRSRSNTYYREEAWREDRYEQDDWDAQEREEAPRSLAQKLRHDFRQWKADRRYNRDYADAPAEGEGPRAALYKGEMGRTHQRAARMQEAATASRMAARNGYARSGVLDRFVLNRHFAIVATVVFCLVVSFNLVYPEAQGYYLKMRETDQAAAEYQAVLERNQELANHVAALQTDEGMEELAHESLGWVHDGEYSVSVITDGSSDPTTDAESQSSAVVSGSVPAPETWYSPVLDAVFGYEG